MSLCLHEYAHAVVAYRAGDRDVAHRGYLTLNPLKYTHPLLSIVLPVVVVLLGGIGLPGGAVWVDRHAIRGPTAAHPGQPRRPGDQRAVHAGAGGAVAARRGHVGRVRWSSGPGWRCSAFLQLTASVLNLLPVPGLDGGNMIQPWLNPQWRKMYDLFAPYGFILLFALLWNPRIGGWFFDAVFAVGDLLGLPSWLYATGLELIRFWR